MCQLKCLNIFFNNIKIYNGGSIEGWLRKITVNTALDHLRVSNRMHFLKIEDSASAWENFTELHRLHDYKTNPDEETEYCKALKYKINEKELLDMIDGLSTSYKICFNLYVFEELKCNEIALKLNLSVGTVKSNLFRARQSLIRKLDKRIEKRVIT
jgi:RNA polymerase sigma-70 factor (ECF subfamily)